MRYGVAMKVRVIAAVLASLVVAAPAVAEPRQRVAVLKFRAVGTTPEQAEVVTNAVVSALSRQRALEVMSQADVASMLSFEQQKQLLGCSDAGCLVELGGAMGASRLVSGSVERLGATYIINAQLHDVARTIVVQRASERVRSEDDLLEAADRVANTLSPAPATVVAPSPPATPAPPVSSVPAPEPHPVAAGDDKPSAQGPVPSRWGAVAWTPELVVRGGSAVLLGVDVKHSSSFSAAARLGRLTSGEAYASRFSGVSPLLGESLEGALALEARWAWTWSPRWWDQVPPERRGGLYAGLGYVALFGKETDTTTKALAVIASMQEPALSLPAKARVTTHHLTLFLGYDWRAWRGLRLGAELGAMRVVGVTAPMTVASDGALVPVQQRAEEIRTAAVAAVRGQVGGGVIAYFDVKLGWTF